MFRMMNRLVLGAVLAPISFLSFSDLFAHGGGHGGGGHGGGHGGHGGGGHGGWHGGHGGGGHGGWHGGHGGWHGGHGGWHGGHGGWHGHHGWYGHHGWHGNYYGYYGPGWGYGYWGDGGYDPYFYSYPANYYSYPTYYYTAPSTVYFDDSGNPGTNVDNSGGYDYYNPSAGNYYNTPSQQPGGQMSPAGTSAASGVEANQGQQSADQSTMNPGQSSGGGMYYEDYQKQTQPSENKLSDLGYNEEEDGLGQE